MRVVAVASLGGETSHVFFIFHPENPGEKGPNLTTVIFFQNGVETQPPTRIRMTCDLFKKSFFRRRFTNRHLHLFTGILGGPTRRFPSIFTFVESTVFTSLEWQDPRRFDDQFMGF